jgi:hypothetical protein
MNIGQIKLWAWAGAGLLTLGLSYYVFDFVTHLDDKSKSPDPKEAKNILENVKPPSIKSDDILSYDEAKRLIAVLDWTGAPPAKPVEAAPVVDNTPKVVPVKRLVIVLGVKQDIGEPANSQVAIKYRPEAGVSDPAIANFSLLKEGDHLAAPQNGVKIESITSERVLFTFADAARPAEELRPSEFDAKSTIVIVGPDGVIKPARVEFQKKEEQYRPGKTAQLGNNRFRLGTDDVKEFGDRYTEILGYEVETARHQDPRTGKYDGIEIKSVKPGSIAARHGAQEGDVIKSINGHPVNSTQEAISFVKTNSNNYTTWEIVVENHGKTRTVTYESSGN